MGVLVLFPGCGPQAKPEKKGPSYADLVLIYSTEVAALDRLEKKREELIKKHEAQLRPSTDKTLELLGDALTSAISSDMSTGAEDAADPGAMLDRLAENKQKARDDAAKLVDSLKAKPVEDKATLKQREALDKQFKEELASLDEEIERQKQRVQRAREARDAAEAAGGQK